MYIVSACLAGDNCKWNGENNLCQKIRDMVDKGEAVAFCPEVLGGLTIPRKPAGIAVGLGQDVIEGKATVRAARGDGEDMTAFFVRGSEKFLRLAKENGIEKAIMKNGSPSCGCGRTWQLDKGFKNHKVDGDGVTVALLKKNGIKVYTEDEFA